MRVAIYARVSTDDKDQDPERQFLPARKYCELHNHEIIGEFKDIGISGDTDPSTRQGFPELKKRKFEGIIIYSMDRLTRQHPMKVMRLLGQYKDMGVKVISITEPAFNMEGEFGDLIQYIISWFNNWYLSNLKKNIKSGLDNARAKGKRLGAPPAQFNKHRAYYLLFNEKMSQRKVAEELNVSVATINRFRKVAMKNHNSFIKKQDIT